MCSVDSVAEKIAGNMVKKLQKPIKSPPKPQPESTSSLSKDDSFAGVGPIFGLNVIKSNRRQQPQESKRFKKPQKDARPQQASRPQKTARPKAKPKVKQIDTSPWELSEFQVEPVEGRVRFHDFDIPKSVMRGIAELSFLYCTPIQAAVIKHTLGGGDATGRAQTGTGKTAAFLLTILTRLLANPVTSGKKATPRALIIAPTRELVIQIAEDCELLSKFTPINVVTVYGGMDYQKQIDQLSAGQVDIVVATPGRLLDFQRKQEIHLSKVEVFVIDEADRMLDMGFIPDVRQVVYSMPSKHKRQTLLFSATLTPEVNNLSAQWTKDPVVVEIEPEKVSAENVKEIIYLVTAQQRYGLLYNIIVGQKLDRVIIFCNRRDETRKLTEILKKCKINCELLSGDVVQKKRMQTLDNFKSGKIQILIATDVAGRGIHVEDVSHVINFTLPYDAEDYVHRIGRTGRAGKSGTSISFASEEDSFYIPDIEEYIGHKLHCEYPDENLLQLPEGIDPNKFTGRLRENHVSGRPNQSKPHRKRPNPRNFRKKR